MWCFDKGDDTGGAIQLIQLSFILAHIAHDHVIIIIIIVNVIIIDVINVVSGGNSVSIVVSNVVVVGDVVVWIDDIG